VRSTEADVEQIRSSLGVDTEMAKSRHY